MDVPSPYHHQGLLPSPLYIDPKRNEYLLADIHEGTRLSIQELQPSSHRQEVEAKT